MTNGSLIDVPKIENTHTFVVQMIRNQKQTMIHLESKKMTDLSLPDVPNVDNEPICGMHMIRIPKQTMIHELRK